MKIRKRDSNNENLLNEINLQMIINYRRIKKKKRKQIKKLLTL